MNISSSKMRQKLGKLSPFKLSILSFAILVLTSCQQTQVIDEFGSWSESEKGIKLGLMVEQDKIHVKLVNISEQDLEFQIGSSYNQGKIVFYHTLSFLHKQQHDSNWTRFVHNWTRFTKIQDYVSPLQIHIPKGGETVITVDTVDFWSPENQFKELCLEDNSIVRAELNIEPKRTHKKEWSGKLFSDIYSY